MENESGTEGNMENKAEPGKKDLFSHTTFFSRNMLLNHIIISNLTTDR